MKGQTNNFAQSAAKQLRRKTTDAERRLWQRLRAQQLGVKFRRQHPFDHYILDFACLERQLIIEIDGGQHAQASDYDDERSRHLIAAGFSVLRFWNNEVMNELEEVVQVIWNA